MNIRKYSCGMRYGMTNGLRQNITHRGRRTANALTNLMSSVSIAALPTQPHHISSLPEVPLLRILQFLDEQSLGKMNRTCRGIKEFIACNRNHLIWVPLYLVTIKRIVDQENKKTIYNVSVNRNFQPVFHIDDCLKYSDPSTSLFSWLARTFRSYRIKNLLLEQFCFDEENLEGLKMTMIDMKLRVESLELSETIFGADLNSTFRILTAINPQYVAFPRGKNKAFLSELFTTDFFTNMAKLRYIEIQKSHSRYCPQFMRLPTHISDNFCYAKVTDQLSEKFVESIHDWFNSGAESTCWWSFPHDKGYKVRYLVLNDLAKDLEVPFNIVRHDNRDKIRITNNGGHVVHIYPMREPEHLRLGILEWGVESGAVAEE